MGVEGCIQPLFKKGIVYSSVVVYLCVCISTCLPQSVYVCVCVYAHTCMPLSHAQYDSLCECIC